MFTSYSAHKIKKIETGFPVGSVEKNLPANARDRRDGFDPWVWKNPWRRK